MDWTPVITGAVGVVGTTVAAVVKRKREIPRIEARTVTRSDLRTELMELEKRFNGRYLHTEVAKAQFAGVERRIDGVDKRMDEFRTDLREMAKSQDFQSAVRHAVADGVQKAIANIQLGE